MCCKIGKNGPDILLKVTCKILEKRRKVPVHLRENTLIKVSRVRRNPSRVSTRLVDLCTMVQIKSFIRTQKIPYRDWVVSGFELLRSSILYYVFVWEDETP